MRLARALSCVLLGALAATPGRAQDSLAVAFDRGTGQVEVGGPFAGVEFHGRPLPARISFYAPVANSIDPSTDYWRRGEARPLGVTVRVDGRTDTLGTAPWAYRWTPYRVVFRDEVPDYAATLDYRFAADLPALVVRLALVNRTGRRAAFRVDTRLLAALRTSHTYATREPTRTTYADGGATYRARFDAADTDSAEVFVLNAGDAPIPEHGPADHTAAFAYERTLAPGDSLVVTQIVGTVRQAESAAVRLRAAQTWAAQVEAYEHGIRESVRDRGRMEIPDPVLAETARLARALLRADRHHLDGQIVPMPSPAEYNFFFTHDLLLTDLGAVFFDPERVRDDLTYVRSLVRADSILPHARYWKDSTFVVEPANADNWNHLWVILLAASHLKHTGDTAAVEALVPTLQKSLALMLANEHGGLMHAERPDWWDIGHVRGPRAYLTALTIRAVDAYAYVMLRLGRADPDLAAHAATAARMRRALPERLWDADAQYLLNGIDSVTTDRHFYTGSLLAAAFGLLDAPRRDALLETARRELLDVNVGVRNAAPMDYHLLTDVYRFQPGEVGAPGLYMNGGVWPQGNAWYALGLIEAGRVDDARDVLARYLSVAGVRDSPNGQPAFYEYRNADPASPAYGAVDKPTFLWAGGWFLHVLYQLAGVRETPWTLGFSPDLPAGYDAVAYDLAVYGAQSRVSWSGAGRTFRRITIDGADSPSAILTGPAARIELERGVPAAPYLSEATAIVERVERQGTGLVVQLRGVAGQSAGLVVVSPTPPTAVLVDGAVLPAASVASESAGGATVVRVSVPLRAPAAVVTLRF